MHSPLLSEKVVLITGAASGLGAAAALMFADYGARVILADIDEDGCKQVGEEVNKNGGESFVTAVDLRVEQDVNDMVEAAVERFGRLDCAFNNAGIDGQMKPLHESTLDNWREVIAVNLTGVWLCLRSEIRQMVRQGGGGSIVNTASIAGVVGYPHNMSAYTAAKHGVVGLTRSAALEYAKQNIRVNAICPGVIRTPMLVGAIAKGIVTEEAAIGSTPLDRMGSPEEIAQAAAWLCSDASSYVTGHPMIADGGWTAQ